MILNSMLKMLYIQIPNQKFDTIRTSVLRDITKIFKKSIILTMSNIYILHNDNAENKFQKKKNCFMNNQMIYSFFILNKFVEFLEPI